MTDEKFEYKSEKKTIRYGSNDLGISITKGLECVWCCTDMNPTSNNEILNFTWKFKLDELKKKGIDRLSGYIILKTRLQFPSDNIFPTQKIDVVLDEHNQIINKCFESRDFIQHAMFEYHLTPHFTHQLTEKLTDEEFENKSGMKIITNGSNNKAICTTKGLECAWIVRRDALQTCLGTLRFTWKYDWSELKKRGINRLSGYITVKPSIGDEQKISVNLKSRNEIIEIDIESRNLLQKSFNATFEYSLTPSYTKTKIEAYKDPVYRQQDVFVEVDENNQVINKKTLNRQIIAKLLTEVFTYGILDFKTINIGSNNLDISNNHGLECEWSCDVRRHIGSTSYDDLHFTWKFNWDELKKKGIKRLSGYISFRSPNGFCYKLFEDQKIDVDLREQNQIIEKVIRSTDLNGKVVNGGRQWSVPLHHNYRALFDYSLIPHYIQNEEVEKNDSSSKLRDVFMKTDEKRVEERDYRINKETLNNQLIEKLTDELYEYKSEMKRITYGSNNLGISMTNGLECDWSCRAPNDILSNTLHFTWKFNWDELKRKGIDRLSGYIDVNLIFQNPVYHIISVNLKESDQIIEKSITTSYLFVNYRAIFNYSLTPHYTQIEEFENDLSSKLQDVFVGLDEKKADKKDINIYKQKHSTDFEGIFTHPKQNDTVFVVDGKKIPVSKKFFSNHSTCFRNLSSLNNKNGKVNEIPIEGISYNDFKLLLGTISPKSPNDETVEKLLELATRFRLPFVIKQCDDHLWRNSKFEIEKKMLMGEKYKMSNILENSIYEIDTLEKATKWKLTPEYIQISDETKKRVLEKFL